MIVSTTDEILAQDRAKFEEQTGERIIAFAHIDDIPEHMGEQIEILVTYGNDLTADKIQRYPNLKFIQLLSAGLEDLPFEALQQKGVLLANAKGIHTVPMSEYVLGAMLHFEKHFDRFMKQQQQEIWYRDTLVGELYQKKVLIYGTGVIGQKIAEKAKCFEMIVHGVNTSGRPVTPFDQVITLREAREHLAEYPFVVVVLPSTDNTRGIFDQHFLNGLSKQAVLINVGRGDLFDESALYRHLRDKKIKGAFLDVFVEEPLPQGNPFWKLDNCIVTPHMSAKSVNYLPRCVEILANNLQFYRQGQIDQLINLVDLERQY